MGFQSQSGKVGFKAQSSKGSYASPATTGIFVRHKSGALAGDRELLIPDPEIGGSRDIPDAYLGPIKFSGEYEFYARMESLASFLYGVSGTKSSSSTGTGGTLEGTHVITAASAAQLPWYSIEENIANGYEEFQYTDAKFNSLHLEADAGGYLMGTVGIVALAQTAGNTATVSPTNTDTSPMVVGSNITVEFAGTALPAKAFSFDVTNNLEDDDFRLGSLFLGDATEKRREASCGVTIRPEDSTLWRQAMYGAGGATSAGGTVTKDDVLITCETYEFIGSTSTVYSLTIEVPVAVIKPFAVDPSGDDVLEHDLEIQFLRPSNATPLYTATVVNHFASVF